MLLQLRLFLVATFTNKAFLLFEGRKEVFCSDSRIIIYVFLSLTELFFSKFSLKIKTGNPAGYSNSHPQRPGMMMNQGHPRGPMMPGLRAPHHQQNYHPQGPQNMNGRPPNRGMRRWPRWKKNPLNVYSIFVAPFLKHKIKRMLKGHSIISQSNWLMHVH